MNYLKMPLKFLWRDARGGELTLLVLALVIAVASSTTISLFADRLQRTMNVQAAEFLAADLAISSSSLLPQAWLDQAVKFQLKQAKTIEFASVVINDEELLLTGAKAVSRQYPLRGYLKTRSSVEQQERLQYSGPLKGETWVDQRVLSALNLQLGEALMLGDKTLRITRVLSYEPDKKTNFYSFSPRVMFNEADLAATHILQPGSRVSYVFQFSGDAQQLAGFKAWVKPLLGASQRIMDLHEDRPELGSALTRAERYLGLSSIIVVLIAGVAIVMSSRRYSERHFNMTAILRCLGSQQNEILWLYLSQFLILGIVACALGSLLGWFTQQALFGLLKDLLPAKVAEPSLVAIMFGFLTGLAILIGFALPPLLRLKNVSPLRVLRRELKPLASSAWLVYGLALTLTALLIARYTQDLRLMLAIIGGGLVVTLISACVLYFLLIQLRRILPMLSIGWRVGLQSVLINPVVSVTQILAFSITLLAMILSFSVRDDLLADWHTQLPDNAPNYFAINIFPDQLLSLETQLQQQGIPTSTFHPIVRGRLVQINQVDVNNIVTKDSTGERATQRDLSLSWGAVLPEDNKTISGQWGQVDKGLVSIEHKLAESLKVKLGDTLTFAIGNKQVNAVVSHIRSVQWDTMQPNFYMVFSAKTLQDFPVSYMGSFYISEKNKVFLNAMVKQFPSVTLLEVSAMLKQFRMILTQLSMAINYLLYFALLAGFTVLFAAVYSTLDNRIYEGALMRALGASRALLRKSHGLEFSFIGWVSGVVAVLMSEVLVYLLYQYVLNLEHQIHWMIWLWLPLVSAICVMLVGSWGVRATVGQPPMRVLREG